MTKHDLIEAAAAFAAQSPQNVIAPESALSPAVANLRMYEAPTLGLAAADEPLFDAFRSPAVIGPHHMSPAEWLPGAKTVISLFFPYTPPIREGNRGGTEPGEGWLHARIEGQAFIVALCQALCRALEAEGHAAIVPAADDRFFAATELGSHPQHPELSFTCNWSERHAAYVSGLGTFGLARGILTADGSSGRLGSVITTLELPPDERPYDAYDAYCTYCGKCARNCPAHAISKENGKEHLPCSRYLDKVRETYAPRYGCGKCQSAVPCEMRIPKRRA